MTFRWPTARLLRDRRGNTLLIAAGSMLPLMAMLGGAMDMTRTYLARTRLQQACDAAVLSGRAAMGSTSWSDTTRATADRYFTANFTPGRYGTSGAAIAYDVGADQIVKGHASVSVPRVIMNIFGFGPANLAVSCDAKLELPNVDIMFVLDTTLSMMETNAGDSVNRITALKGSVQNFYAALEHARAANTRIRYGFVPYSSTVNVGMLLRPDWLADQWTYQSRVPDGTTQTESTAPDTVSSYSAWTKVGGTITSEKYTIPPENCTAPANTTKSATESSPPQDNSDGTKSWTETQTISGTSYSASLSNGVCTVTATTYKDYVQKRTVTQKPNPDAGKKTYTTNYWWKYQPVSYPLGALKNTDGSGAMLGGEFAAIVGDAHASRTVKWNKTNGCIEERQTSATADPANPITGYDVDVDSTPTAGTAATRWRPRLPGLVYARRQTSATSQPTANWGAPTTVVRTTTNYFTPSASTELRGACPTYARKLAEIDAATLSGYLSELKPAGLTYHDIGFLWGLRLLSAQGLFAAENQSPATGKLARHLIFMTDGTTETNIGDYDAYGLSALDRRRTPANRLPTAAEQNTIVENRLTGYCGVAKAKGITVWVIAFGTTLTPLLSACAAEGHAFQAKNAAELQEAFTNIAGRIAQLRLVK